MPSRVVVPSPSRGTGVPGSVGRGPKAEGWVRCTLQPLVAPLGFGQLVGDEGSHGPDDSKRQDDFPCSVHDSPFSRMCGSRSVCPEAARWIVPSLRRRLRGIPIRSDSPRWYRRRWDCLFPFMFCLRYHLRNSLGRNAAYPSPACWRLAPCMAGGCLRLLRSRA